MKPQYKDLEHASTVIVLNTETEKSVVLNWAEIKGKIGGACIKNMELPFCISVEGKIVGFVNEMDRALYYMSFEKFMTLIHN